MTQNTPKGWLIVHTEGKEHISYELKEGKNTIGRPTPNFKPDIPINDKFVSRRHAVIIVKLNQYNIYEYYVADNQQVNDGKPSMNGTFINGNTERIGEKPVKIIDGDTIQVGETKLVLKSADININVEEAVKLVKRQEYKTTIDVLKQSKLRKKL
jgi:pSer/pThr/pTyr-binding forkhead associated (FHA) protein